MFSRGANRILHRAIASRCLGQRRSFFIDRSRRHPRARARVNKQTEPKGSKEALEIPTLEGSIPGAARGPSSIYRGTHLTLHRAITEPPRTSVAAPMPRCGEIAHPVYYPEPRSLPPSLSLSVPPSPPLPSSSHRETILLLLIETMNSAPFSKPLLVPSR